MDFGVMPPEINSARMYSGAGPTPLLGAAAAWDDLAGELHSAAELYRSVICRVTGTSWSGPAATAMLAAAAPYVAWLSTTAANAEQAAGRARETVLAYEAAFAATVPPAEIAANRSLLSSLEATNALGQNSPAIATTEAQYAEMWARDATAMYGYANASWTASMVVPFETPPQTTRKTALDRRRGDLAQAVELSGQEKDQSHLVAAIQRVLQKLSSSSSLSETWDDLKTYLPQIQKNLATSETLLQRFASTPSNILGLAKSLTAPAKAAAAGGAAVPTAAAEVPAVVGLTGAGVPGGGISAGLGRAGTLGSLSVPPSWASEAPVTSPGVSSLPVQPADAGPHRPAGLLRGIPMSGAGRGHDGYVTRYGVRHNVIPRSPVIG